ncbi:MAG: DNA helicase RecQ [Pirellulaceae bacterium]|jgi:ATP-dependent DNA helicase RecQ
MRIDLRDRVDIGRLSPADSERELRCVMQRVWGYSEFLPLQLEAMQSVLSGQDALVVMPTGGGKSLCFQAPALCRTGMALVVSPLIALMKDQVDGLRECGMSAAAIHSGLSADERRSIAARINDGSLKFLYVAPERLLTDAMLEFLRDRPITLIAIDEAHCISSWGHDFRPEYRELWRLGEVFPGVPRLALTATATSKVRDDIVGQLRLDNSRMLVGDFRRSNLTYHVARRAGGLNQICSVLDRYRDSSGIVYCISRSDVEETSSRLNAFGYRTLPYHAGLSDDVRRSHQDAFIHDQAATMVATIAFGMGIDKSNVRYVIHAGMPQSLENYQQESGRAGRDGLPAECWLLYSSQDRQLWRRILQDAPEESQLAGQEALQSVLDYCTTVGCRQQELLKHFGQKLEQPCGACDICLGELQLVDEPLIVAQKILSCVLRVDQRFGADYVSKVLIGSNEKRIVRFGHQRLSTWGILKEYSRSDIRDWLEQLQQQGYLARSGEHQVLVVTEAGRDLLHGTGEPRLLRAISSRQATTAWRIVDSWEGVDRGLFGELRELRRELATAAQLPSYLIFSDATLKDIARRRPSTIELFLMVHGVGERKAQQYGERFLSCVADYCQRAGVQLDPVTLQEGADSRGAGHHGGKATGAAAQQAFELFEKGMGVEQVADLLQRARSTTYDYLEAYIEHAKITDATRWCDAYEILRIETVADYVDDNRLKPIHTALHGAASYESIRIVLACKRNRVSRR